MISLHYSSCISKATIQALSWQHVVALSTPHIGVSCAQPYLGVTITPIVLQCTSPSDWHLQSFNFTCKGSESCNTVTHIPKINRLWRGAIVKLGVKVFTLLGMSLIPGKETIQNLTKEITPDVELQQACRKLGGKFTECFKPVLDCLVKNAA